MVYIDITIEQELKALVTLEDENDKKVSKKWKNIKARLAEFCGVIFKKGLDLFRHRFADELIRFIPMISKSKPCSLNINLVNLPFSFFNIKIPHRVGFFKFLKKFSTPS
ncbi:hypothetical protein [Clostridium sp.]|uniref:hypothetical protein n=1 Tax=Clostridium sp. TaxID=1506 RepID=UPI003D6D3746